VIEIDTHATAATQPIDHSNTHPGIHNPTLTPRSNKMGLQIVITTACACLISLTTCDAFTLTPPVSTPSSTVRSYAVVHAAPCHPRCQTVATFAKKSDDAAEEEETPAEEEKKETKNKKKEEPATDILSSPSFLKRKLEVLKTDTAKVDEKSDAANELFKAGKAEWGSKIDLLRSEVRSLLSSSMWSSVMME